MQGFLNGGHDKVEVASNDSDDKQVDGHRSCLYDPRHEVYYQGQCDSDPHLADDIRGDEHEEAPGGIGDEERTSCKRSSQNLHAYIEKSTLRRLTVSTCERIQLY